MNGLPAGQYAEYLLIAVIATIAGFLLQSLVRARFKTAGMKVWALVGLAILAVLGYAVVERFSTGQNKAQISKTSEPPGNTDPPSTNSTAANRSSDDPQPNADPRRNTSATSPDGRPAENLPSAARLFFEKNVVSPPANARRPGQWAIVIAEARSANNHPRLTSEVRTAVSDHGRSVVGIFRPTVNSEPNFSFLFDADPELLRMLSQYCDRVFLGRVTETINENNTSLDFKSVTLALNVKILSTQAGAIEAEFESEATGAGSKLEEARSTAEERLADELRNKLRESMK